MKQNTLAEVISFRISKIEYLDVVEPSVGQLLAVLTLSFLICNMRRIIETNDYFLKMVT